MEPKHCNGVLVISYQQILQNCTTLMSHRWVPGVLEGRRSSSTFQCPNCCLADEEDMGVRVGSEAGGKKEEGSRILLCSVSFFGLTHIFLQFKKKENRDLFGLPLLSLHAPALSHRSSKLSNLSPLKCEKRRGFLYFKSQAWALLWGWIFQGKDLICHLNN